MPRMRFLPLVALLAATSTLAACADDEPAMTDAEAQALLEEISGPTSVVYEVEGTADSVSITIQTPSGSSQAANRAVPLTSDGSPGIEIAGFTAGDFVYLSAQNEGEYGTVTCRISVDGDVVSEVTSTGAYTIATCDATA